MAMTLVSTVTVGAGGASSIQFTNVPQTGKDLLVVASLRNVTNAPWAIFSVNGLAGGVAANYPQIDLIGDGSVSSSANNNNSYFFGSNNGGFTANTFSSLQIYIANYTNSLNKSISTDTVIENNATVAYQQLAATRANVTAAVTSVELTAPSQGFTQHSTASLYIIS